MAGQGEQTYTAIADAAGNAVITIPQRNVIWVVSQVSIELPSSTAPGATCVLRKNGNAITPLVAWLDAAGGDPPLRLLASDSATIEWANLDPDDVAKAVVIYTQEDYA